MQVDKLRRATPLMEQLEHLKLGQDLPIRIEDLISSLLPSRKLY